MIGFYYDGAQWLSDTLYHSGTGIDTSGSNVAISVTTVQETRWAPPIQSGGSNIWIVDHQVEWFVTGGTALSGSHKWTGAFAPMLSNNALGSALATPTIASGALTTWQQIITHVNALLTRSTAFLLGTTWTKTGTPGTLLVYESYSYRIVAT